MSHGHDCINGCGYAHGRGRDHVRFRVRDHGCDRVSGRDRDRVLDHGCDRVSGRDRDHVRVHARARGRDHDHYIYQNCD